MVPDDIEGGPDPLRSPVTTLDWQLDLIRWAQSERLGRHIHHLDRIAERPILPSGRLLAETEAAFVGRSLLRSLDGWTCWVSDDAARMVEDASLTVPPPDTGAVSAGIIPQPAGMIWLAGDPAMVFYDHPIRAVSWVVQGWPVATVDGPAMAPCVVVWPWSESGPQLLPVPPIALPLAPDALAMIPDDERADIEARTNIHGHMAWDAEGWTDETMAVTRWTLAAWIMCGEVLPRLIVSGTRAHRRRAQRLDVRWPEWGDVHVTTLRTRDRGEGTYTEGERQYNHQWIVSGHWRWQACGPGRLHRRLVWVRPHIKGPEGAPLIEIDQVGKLVR